MFISEDLVSDIPFVKDSELYVGANLGAYYIKTKDEFERVLQYVNAKLRYGYMDRRNRFSGTFDGADWYFFYGYSGIDGECYIITKIAEIKSRIDEFMDKFSVRRENVLDQLLDWAIECDFGLDSLGDTYEQYKDQLTDDMSYKDMIIKIAECYMYDLRGDTEDGKGGSDTAGQE